MPRAIPLAAALLALFPALLSAETPGEDSKAPKNAPREGQKWVDQKPVGGGSPLTLVLQGKESVMYDLPPGGELAVLVPGENRLLVLVRRDFDSRTSPEATSDFTWSMADGVEHKVSFKSGPHKTALFIGKASSVPGRQDSFIIDVPEQGGHVVTFRMPKDAPAGASIGLLIERSRKAMDETSNAPSAHKDTWWMGITTRFRIGYDDNVWHFSHQDVSDYDPHNADDPNDKYDRMASVGDFYVDSDFDAHIISPAFELGQFVIGGSVNTRAYLQNHRKNRETYRGYVKHEPFETFHYEAFASISPDHFVRNSDPQDTPGFQRVHAHYDDYTIGGRVWYRILPSLSANFTWTWELRDWNGSFNERDTKYNHFDLGLNYSPTPWLKLDLDLEHTRARSLATGDERDGSFREISPRVGVDLKLNRILLGVSWQFEDRKYTTLNSGTIDPFHANRRDHKHVFGVYAGARLGESTSLVLSYRRTVKRTSLPGRQSAGDPRDIDEELEYDSNTVELTFEMKWP